MFERGQFQGSELPSAIEVAFRSLLEGRVLKCVGPALMFSEDILASSSFDIALSHFIFLAVGGYP